MTSTLGGEGPGEGPDKKMACENEKKPAEKGQTRDPRGGQGRRTIKSRTEHVGSSNQTRPKKNSSDEQDVERQRGEGRLVW